MTNTPTKEPVFSAKGMRLSPKAERAIHKYGTETCRECYRLYASNYGGASTIGWEQGLTTNQADAAINAGRELAGHTLTSKEG